MSNITKEGLDQDPIKNKGKKTTNILDLIGELVKTNPNDADLGEQIRKLYKQINNSLK